MGTGKEIKVPALDDEDLQFMTMAEVCELLRFSPWKVRQEVQSGRLQGMRIGRPWRFPVSAVRAYVDRLRETA